eukprot:EG_transcript_22481
MWFAVRVCNTPDHSVVPSTQLKACLFTSPQLLRIFHALCPCPLLFKFRKNTPHAGVHYNQQYETAIASVASNPHPQIPMSISELKGECHTRRKKIQKISTWALNFL